MITETNSENITVVNGVGAASDCIPVDDYIAAEDRVYEALLFTKQEETGPK